MSKGKPSQPMTTLAVGEEEKVAPEDTLTTLAVGEEDPVPSEPQDRRASTAVPGDNPLGAW